MSPIRESKPQGEPKDVRAGEDGKSEGHPVMGWIGVEPKATSPHAKAGRRPSGLSSQESLINLLRREGR
jgi:hypothetical protein